MHRIPVYLVDDHDRLRAAVRNLLECAHDIRVVGECGTVAEALRRIPMVLPSVLVADVNLLDGSGIDLCRQVRARDHGIRVVMFTAEDNTDLRAAALDAGASSYIVKQISNPTLIETVRALGGD